MPWMACVRACILITKWIPVAFVIGVLFWSYYAYVIQLCLYHVDNIAKRTLYIFFYHVFLYMFAWSYLKTVLTPIKRPSSDFYMLDTELYQMELAHDEQTTREILEKKAKHLPLITRTKNAKIRYCDKCRCIKPDRAHHCSVCNSCVLKMDHHCPWVNNCVGFSNYKFFILFLFYAVTYCVFISLTSFEYFILFWNEMQSMKSGLFHLLFLFFVALMFGICIFSLFSYHIYLMCQNLTTLETFRAPTFTSTGLSDKSGFHLGKLENFKQVMGKSYLMAFLPIQTCVIDGISFPTSVGQTLASTHSAGMADTNGNSYTPFSTESVLLNEQANSGGSAYSEPQVVSRQNYSIDNNNKNKQHISLYID